MLRHFLFKSKPVEPEPDPEPEEQDDYEFFTPEEFASFVAARLDSAKTLSGAAGNYRKHLLRMGFDDQIAQMVAAQWLVNFSEVVQ